MPTEPEKERRRLTELYARMPLEDLQKLAEDRESLTEIAIATLAAELRRRGVSDVISEVAFSTQSGEKNDDDSTASMLFVLCRFRDVHEALLAQSALDSAGIQSFLADENIVAVRLAGDWRASSERSAADKREFVLLIDLYGNRMAYQLNGKDEDLFTRRILQDAGYPAQRPRFDHHRHAACFERP